MKEFLQGMLIGLVQFIGVIVSFALIMPEEDMDKVETFIAAAIIFIVFDITALIQHKLWCKKAAA